MTHSFLLSICPDFYRFYRFILEETSIHQKIKTEIMQKLNLLTIEWQLRVKGSNIYHCTVYQTSSLIKKFKKNLIFSLKPGLKSSGG